MVALNSSRDEAEGRLESTAASGVGGVGAALQKSDNSKHQEMC
jgi:hypothetical protein